MGTAGGGPSRTPADDAASAAAAGYGVRGEPSHYGSAFMQVKQFRSPVLRPEKPAIFATDCRADRRESTLG
jgi:hypothetical protein